MNDTEEQVEYALPKNKIKVTKQPAVSPKNV